MRRTIGLWTLGPLLALACATAKPVPPPAPALTVEARAQQLVARAAEVEPTVTPKLMALAEQTGGDMYKLEFRLKSLESTTRKLKLEAMERPDTPIAELDLDDTLRYTMHFEDEPPGHHVASIKRVLAALEADGHEVMKLKNYWPPNDNYSGVNTILRDPSGLDWELQFHTQRSLEVQKETRAWYEELRKMATHVERKRELFDLMTAAWAEVPIPEGILEPKSLHPREELRDRERP